MSDFMRALVSTYKATDLAADFITNTVYFKKINADVSDPDWQAIATDVANLFATAMIPPAGYNRVNCRVYDMEDATPREVKGEFLADSFPVGSAATSPREVALCLSYYAERNLPRNRGRIYLGPIRQPAGERPSATQIAEAHAIGEGLANIGGVNIEHCVYSERSGLSLGERFKQVSHYWVDDEWDTIRSRGLKATARNLVAREG